MTTLALLPDDEGHLDLFPPSHDYKRLFRPFLTGLLHNFTLSQVYFITFLCHKSLRWRNEGNTAHPVPGAGLVNFPSPTSRYMSSYLEVCLLSDFRTFWKRAWNGQCKPVWEVTSWFQGRSLFLESRGLEMMAVQRTVRLKMAILKEKFTEIKNSNIIFFVFCCWMSKSRVSR